MTDPGMFDLGGWRAQIKRKKAGRRVVWYVTGRLRCPVSAPEWAAPHNWWLDRGGRWLPASSPDTFFGSRDKAETALLAGRLTNWGNG